jgi:hypothetical protein
MLQLRPYLPTRYLATALCSGSIVLSRRVWEWVTSSGARAARGRLAGIALGVYVAGYEELHGQTWILPVVCGAWIVGALVHSPTAPAAKVDEDEDQEDGEQLLDDEEAGESASAAAPAPPVPVALVARLAHELAAAPNAANSRAVQLDHLIAHLPGASKAALVASLTGVGVPIREVKYRLAGGRQQVRQGVRLKDLPTTPEEAPPAPAPGLRVLPSQAPAEEAAGTSPAAAPDPSLRAG